MKHAKEMDLKMELATPVWNVKKGVELLTEIVQMVTEFVV